MARKIDKDKTPAVVGARYPAPLDAPCRQRLRRRLGDAAGLTQFGVNLTKLPPGCWSSQRHWHSAEDEFIYVVEGELVMITDSGEEILHAGDCAAFPAGTPDGHHLQNRSERDALVLEVGSRQPAEDEVVYPDVDLRAQKGRAGYTRRDGTVYPGVKPRNPAAKSE
ncbi:MAG: cupin domain-containing protein [Steroidobacteraceae bacterium]